MRPLRAAVCGGCRCCPARLSPLSRAFSTSRPRLALERVEVAHAQAYTRRVVTVGFTSAGSAGAGKASPSSSNGDKLANYVSFVADDTTGPSPTKENGALAMRSMRSSTAAEYFFFLDGAKNYCRLCLEESEMVPKMHMVAPNRASHLNHACREVVLDSLALLCMRGYPVDDIFLIWSDVLYSESLFQRIPQLVSPRWSISERTKALSHLLTLLKDLGVIDISLAAQAPDGFDNAMQQKHHRRRIAFERLEYIGDNSWGNHLSNRIMLLFPDRQWTYSQHAFSFNCFRDACEMNVTLEFMFDTLRISDLLPRAVRDKLGTGKIKADVVEALIGELHVTLWGFEPQIYDSSCFVEVNGFGEAQLSSLVQHCLTEIYDLIILSYAQELSVSAIPLAKEIAADRIWRRAYPPVRRTKDRAGAARKGRGATTVIGVGEVWQLPSIPSLHTSPQAFPYRVADPLRAMRSVEDIAEETICTHTRRDVFEHFISSYERLGLLDDRLVSTTMDIRPMQRVQFAALKRQLVPSLPCEFIRTDLERSDTTGEEEEEEGRGEGRGNYPNVEDSFAHAHAPGGPNGNDLEMEEVYFRDAYFDLFPKAFTPHMWDGNSNSDGDGDSGGRGVTTRGLTRGVHLPLATPCGAAMDRAAQLEMATAMVYPRLSETQVEVPREGNVKWDRVCLFAPSVFVPEGTKPPSAGVVTEKNLHYGEFAFAMEKECVKDALDGKAKCVQTITTRAEGVSSDAEAELKEEQTEEALEEEDSEAKQTSGLRGDHAVLRLMHTKWTIDNPFFPCKTGLSTSQNAT